MGVIKRQGIKQTLVNYLATFIGAISVLFVYPRGEGIYSLAGFIIGGATLVAPFISLGANSLTIRFYPHFKDAKKKDNGFLGLVLSYGFFFMALSGIGIYFFGNHFVVGLQKWNFDKSLLETYQWHIYFLAILMVCTNVLTSHSSNFSRITIPAIFNSLIYKIALPLLILLYIAGVLTTATFSYSVLGYYLLGVAGLLFYVNHLGGLNLRTDWSLVNFRLGKEMWLYALIGVVGSFGSALTYQIDRLMVPALIDLKQADVYNISLYIGNSIELPIRSIIAVTGPIIAAAWHNKDLLKINDLYRRASLNLFLIGLFIFLGIWVSIDELFQLTSKYERFKAGQMVVLLVGITKLFDMATSINGQVIGYSKYYYFNLITIAILGISNVFLNYLFIVTLGYGILGPAIASFISITIFNLVRVWFIWYVFKLHPFSVHNLTGLLVAIAVYLIIVLIPNTDVAWLDIGINSILVAILYVPTIYYLKISDDFNEQIVKGVEMIRKFLRIDN